MQTACGIDFGTTNSTIGVVYPQSKDVHMIPLEDGKSTLPTALFFPKNENQVLFGKQAIKSYINGADGRFIRSIKRILGTELIDKFTLINSKSMRFDTLIKIFLSHLKSTAEQTIDKEITDVIIGRPVHFQTNDDLADKKAEDKLYQTAQMAGFKNIGFQYEPIAAAFSHERELLDEKLALVVDLGGGTSDFTLIRIGPKSAQKTDRSDDILSTSGIRVGGNDFDKALCLSSFMPCFGYKSTYGEKHMCCPNFIFSELSEWSKINFTYTQKNIEMVKRILSQSDAPDKIERLLTMLEFEEAHYLLQVVEESKIRLTQEKSFDTTFNTFSEQLSFSVNQDSFFQHIKDDVHQIEQAMQACLTSAGISKDAVDLVILTGGSCEIPLIQSTFKALFPQATFSEKEKLLSVGVGLAYSAMKMLD